MIEMSMPLSYHVCRAPGALQRILARLAGDGAARAGRTSRVLQARIALQSSRALRSRHTCQSVPLLRRHRCQSVPAQVASLITASKSR